VPAGLSTPDQRGAAATPKRLTREEFEKRLFSRAKKRYGLELDRRWLADLIKDGLIPGAVRDGNDGKRPIYGYGSRSYRAGLQMARFRHDNVVDRDAIQIMMFLKGYGNIPDIRHALNKGYSEFVKTALANVRSGYIYNHRPIPAKHERSLSQTLGPLDPQFDAAGLRLDPDVYIKLLRNARQSPINQTPLFLARMILSSLTAGKVEFPSFAAGASALLNGLLLLAPDGKDKSPDLDYIERLISASSDQHYLEARAIYRLVISSHFACAADSVKSDEPDEALREAFRKASAAIRLDPRWAASILVFGLLVAHRGTSTLNADVYERLSCR
jgi:hypothetical protein